MRWQRKTEGLDGEGLLSGMCLLLIPTQHWSPQQPYPVWTGYLSFTLSNCLLTRQSLGGGAYPIPVMIPESIPEHWLNTAYSTWGLWEWNIQIPIGLDQFPHGIGFCLPHMGKNLSPWKPF